MSISIQGSSRRAARDVGIAHQPEQGRRRGRRDVAARTPPAPQNAPASIIDLSGRLAAGSAASPRAWRASPRSRTPRSRPGRPSRACSRRCARMRSAPPIPASTATRARRSTPASKSGLAQIQEAVASAGVDGVNLIDGSVNGAASGSAATLTGVNLSLGGPLIGLPARTPASADPADGRQPRQPARHGDRQRRPGGRPDLGAGPGDRDAICRWSRRRASSWPGVAGGVNGGAGRRRRAAGGAAGPAAAFARRRGDRQPVADGDSVALPAS